MPTSARDITTRDADCRAFNERAFALASAPDVDKVVLAARWSTHLCGRVYDSDQCTPDLARRVRADGTERRFSSVAELHAAVKAQLEDTITVLARQGKRVWLVAPAPMYRTSVAGLVARHHMFGAPLSSVEITRAQHERLHATALRMLRELARETPARVIDPADALCAGATCLLERDGHALYLDPDHLTKQGAQLLAPTFARALE